MFGAYAPGEGYFGQSPIGPAYVSPTISDADLLRYDGSALYVDGGGDGLYIDLTNDGLYLDGPSDE